jgi:hypothetical protein
MRSKVSRDDSGRITRFTGQSLPFDPNRSVAVRRRSFLALCGLEIKPKRTGRHGMTLGRRCGPGVGNFERKEKGWWRPLTASLQSTLAGNLAPTGSNLLGPLRRGVLVPISEQMIGEPELGPCGMANPEAHHAKPKPLQIRRGQPEHFTGVSGRTEHRATIPAAAMGPTEARRGLYLHSGDEDKQFMGAK